MVNGHGQNCMPKGLRIDLSPKGDSRWPVMAGAFAALGAWNHRHLSPGVRGAPGVGRHRWGPEGDAGSLCSDEMSVLGVLFGFGFGLI